MSKFKPMLAPNESVSASDIPVNRYYASLKLDGIRCIFMNGQMLSRSLKPIPNKQLNDRFQPLKDFTKKTGVILDGEIYDHDMTFQDIQSYTRTDDFESQKSVKKYKGVREIPATLKFHLFDVIPCIGGQLSFEMPFWKRIEDYLYPCIAYNERPDLISLVHQRIYPNDTELMSAFKGALDSGFEGLILKENTSRYKCGRGTIKEGLIYKFKPYETFDSRIEEVIQQTVAREGSEKKINELGNSVTSKKMADRVPIDRASAFVVKYGDQTLKVSLSSMDHAERNATWLMREELVGKHIEYKGMDVGSKDVPRHPVFIRYRPDKDS